MRSIRFVQLAVVAAVLSGCVTANSAPSFAQKEDEYIPLAAAILTIAQSEDGGPTPKENFGTSLAIYEGIIHSSREYTFYDPETNEYSGIDICNTCSFGGTGPLTEYLAELYLEVDFNSQTVSGDLSKFFTPLAGFKNPNGTISIVGSIATNSDGGDIVFSGAGTLEGTGMNADYEIYYVYGRFGGVDAQILVGGFLSNFDWQTGTYEGSRSQSDGLWVAQVQ